MTFNLRYDEVKDGMNAWPYRADKAADVILESGAALVGTQEGLDRMLTDLERKLGRYGRIGDGRDRGRDGEFCAIFYDREALELLEHGQFWLSEQPDEPGSLGWDASYPRICTWGYFRTLREPQTELLMFNTHLDHMGQTARENGSALVRRTMSRERERIARAAGRDSRTIPTILTGDFNAEPDNPAVRLLREQPDDAGGDALNDAYEAHDGAPGRTFHEFQGGFDGEPIDYIFVSRGVRVSETKVVRETVRGGYPSDHYPVLATLDI